MISATVAAAYRKNKSQKKIIIIMRKKRMRKGLQWLINEDDLKSPTSLCCTLFSPGDKKRNKSIVIYVIFIYVTSFII